jgi:hypothetical protein
MTQSIKTHGLCRIRSLPDLGSRVPEAPPELVAAAHGSVNGLVRLFAGGASPVRGMAQGAEPGLEISDVERKALA